MKFNKIMYSLARVFGYTLHRLSKDAVDYDQDGLFSIHNHDFMNEAKFSQAYARGVVANGSDFNWHWRVHVGLWTASCAIKLDGDFVECGVNRGFLSSSIMSYVDWSSYDKSFYLMDTFCGIDERYIAEDESNKNIMDRNDNDMYVKTAEKVIENFSEWKNVEVVVGAIPDTLEMVKTDKIAYLHIDMNCAPPEVAALNYFWDKVVPGGFILFDDYAFKGYEVQKKAIDEVALSKNVSILSLPTGQGLIVKPCSLI